MASTTPAQELYTNYKNYEDTISGATVYAIATGLGRNAAYARVLVTAASKLKINGGEDISLTADLQYEITDKVIITLTITPNSGSADIYLYAD